MTRRSHRSWHGCAIPTSGVATCARNSPRTGSPSSASPSSAHVAGANRSSPRWTSSTRTRSGVCAPGSRRYPTGAMKPATSWRESTATSRCTRRSRSGATTVSIDFTGTAPQHDGNLNCPLSVARSACFYVLRVLVDPDLPASGGAFAPVTVTAPAGCLVNARPPAAVAAGNVETSSRIVDVVMRAFGQAVDGAGAGTGDDEQRHARQRPLHVLRDDRRRSGRLPGCRRAERRPRRDVEHALDTGRGARAPVSAARRALRPAARLGWSRCASRWRRCRPRAARAGGLQALDHQRAPPPRTGGRTRRRGRGGRPERAERCARSPPRSHASSRPATS